MKLILENIFAFCLWFYISKVTIVSILIKKSIYIFQTLGHSILNQLISFLLLGYFTF